MALSHQGIIGLGKVYYNLIEPTIVEHALARKEGQLGIGGALLVSTGKFTGRSPKDKHIVKTASTTETIWWENNAEMSEVGFSSLYEDMIEHMQGKDYFVQDLFAGADPTMGALRAVLGRYSVDCSTDWRAWCGQGTYSLTGSRAFPGGRVIEYASGNILHALAAICSRFCRWRTAEQPRLARAAERVPLGGAKL